MHIGRFACHNGSHGGTKDVKFMVHSDYFDLPSCFFEVGVAQWLKKRPNYFSRGH